MIPKDVDYIVTGQKIDLESGKTILIAGPTNEDEFALSITELRQVAEEDWYANVSINAKVANGNVFSGVAETIRIKAGESVGPITVGTHSFYVFVEEVSVGFAKLAVARRMAAEPAAGVRNNWSYGAQYHTGRRIPVPEPIIAENNSGSGV